MRDDWNFYFYNVNEKLASIFLNVGLAPEAPISSKPLLLWVWVYFQSPREDGLSDGAEAPTLYEIEDALNLHLGKNCGALLSGRITTQGSREFYFYAETEKGFDEAVAVAMANFEIYKFWKGGKPDPSWKQYFEVLYPPPDVMQKIQNRNLLDVLVKRGDVPSLKREVNHWIYFKTTASRESFRLAASNAGFATTSQPDNEGDRTFGIVVGRTQAIEQELIDETVVELFRLSEKFDGEYDGWETPITTH